MKKFWFAFFLGLLAGLAIAHHARAADSMPALDYVPNWTPLSATMVSMCEPNAPIMHPILIELTYASGAILRFDAEHTYGLTLEQMLALGKKAKNQKAYVVNCGTAI